MDRRTQVIEQQTHIEAQMDKLVTQLKPWVRTLIEASEVRVEARMTATMDRFMQELYWQINSFEQRMGNRLWEAIFQT